MPVVNPVATEGAQRGFPQASRQNQLLKMLGEDAMFIWGMAPMKFFIGFDMLGLPTERYQTHGFRHMVLMDFHKLAEELPPFIPQDIKPEIEETEKHSLSQMFENVLPSLTQAQFIELTKAMGPACVMHGTLGPGQAMYVPSGWCAAERTLTQAAMGLRRVTLHKNTMETLVPLQGHRAKESAVLEAARKISVAIAA